MRAVLALSPRPWARPWALMSSGSSTGAGGPSVVGRVRGPGALSVLAFAIATALGLIVVGGLVGFLGRDDHPTTAYMREFGDDYVLLAWMAVVLLFVPLVALGGAAARLGVARRDARLATLRLLGVTSREVVGLTLVETARQGLAGAALGIAGYGVLLPVFTQIPFMDQPFTAAEMWVGWQPIAVALLLVPLVAAASGAVSLRRVVVSPLGVARRTTPPGLRWVRLLALAGAMGAFAVATSAVKGAPFAIGATVLIGLVGVVFGTINLVGPWTIALLARIMARTARRPAPLLAARRLLDDPRGAWRVVGGLGMAAFVAGVLSVLPMATETGAEMSTDDRLLSHDIMTGGLLTLAIAFALAAASAGIAQAATVLDRRREYALQQLAGVPAELFDSVRRLEVFAPLGFVLGTSVLVAWGLLLPVVGLAGSASADGMLLLAACLAVGVVLVAAATETCRPLLRSVLHETVVRAD